MKIVSMMAHVAILTLFYIAGIQVQKWFSLSIPASIIGMLLLFLALITKSLPIRFIEEGASFVLRHMPLLFLPVTVGILQFLDVFAGDGILLIFITLISTVMVMVISGLIGQTLMKRKEVQKKP